MFPITSLKIWKVQSRTSPHTTSRCFTSGISASLSPPPLPTTPTTPITTTQPSRLETLLSNARLTHMAHDAWSQILRPGDTVVDATSGNGHDTLFLAKAIGPSGQIYAFDLQQTAIESTISTIEQGLSPESRPKMHYVAQCHRNLQHIVGTHTARLVAFNLGYLPGGDKNVITRQTSTLAAIEASFEVLHPGGLLSILAYTGHEGGPEEFSAVAALLEQLPPKYWVSTQVKVLNRPTAPVLLLAWKK
ncbi:putative rRNA methylase YtqB [Nannochloris sp. 'desiccata']|nr:putative rRNA methylase YtqB [Chlorella desiccata (nom. nud.)]KAH7616563.1 putative rRNA methylase YtqB [Chlorella desiccata (nom. nud.)]